MSGGRGGRRTVGRLASICQRGAEGFRQDLAVLILYVNNSAKFSKDRTNGVFFRNSKNTVVQFLTNRRNFCGVDIQFFQVVLAE